MLHQIDSVIATSAAEGMISMDNSIGGTLSKRADHQGYRRRRRDEPGK
jgi:hypothetical protein